VVPFPDTKQPVLLIGNYPPDKQYSMQLYLLMIYEGLKSSGVYVDKLAPYPVLGRYVKGNKWIGYVDKFIIFPKSLKKFVRFSNPSPLIHVCDHSNSMYLKTLEKNQTVLTCHDLIAIRSASGEFFNQHTKYLGQLLQRLIKRNIPMADKVVCVSNSTKEDLCRIYPKIDEKTRVVYSSFSKKFNVIDQNISSISLEKKQIDFSLPFLLHVGNNAWYKNRSGVIEIYKRFLEKFKKFDLNLVLVGPELDESQKSYLENHSLSTKVQCLNDVDHLTLEALYNLAEAFLFPSRYEGFGWPPLEAQCCGCPVVASNEGSLREVLLESAFTADWDDVDAHVDNLGTLLENPSLKAQLIKQGFENVKRFNTESMIQSLCEVYGELSVA